MSAAVTLVTGATLVRLGVGMRVPVTTISETSALPAAGAAAAAAEAWVAERPSKVAPQIIEEASRRSRVELIFKSKPSIGPSSSNGPQRNGNRPRIATDR